MYFFPPFMQRKRGFDLICASLKRVRSPSSLMRHLESELEKRGV